MAAISFKKCLLATRHKICTDGKQGKRATERAAVEAVWDA